MKLLNVGCGAHYHPQWVNLDLVPAAPEVRACDLRRGINMPDASVDAVYHAHVIEHLKPREAERLLVECLRVLRPGGVLRVVAPDLEGIAREYLAALDRCQQGECDAEADLEWMRLELLDQLTRDSPGGEMGRRMRAPDLANARFVESRLGAEFCGAAAARGSRRTFAASVRRRVANGRRSLTCAAAYVLGGRRGWHAVREGWFRQSGEIHRWMYDCVSLGRLLERTGYCRVTQEAFNTSAIENFAAYELDEAGGRPRKPDSFYMEGRKPD